MSKARREIFLEPFIYDKAKDTMKNEKQPRVRRDAMSPRTIVNPTCSVGINGDAAQSPCEKRCCALCSEEVRMLPEFMPTSTEPSDYERLGVKCLA